METVKIILALLFFLLDLIPLYASANANQINKIDRSQIISSYSCDDIAETDELIIKFKDRNSFGTLGRTLARSFNIRKKYSKKKNVAKRLRRYKNKISKLDKLFPDLDEHLLKSRIKSRAISKKSLKIKEMELDANFDLVYVGKYRKNILKSKKRKKCAKIKNLIHKLNRDRDIEYVEPNFKVHINSFSDDFFYNSSNTWSHGYDDLWGIKKIKADQAWQYSMGEDVVVAVIDTGVDYNHPDLWDNIWVNPDLVSDVNNDGKISLDDLDLNHNRHIEPEEYIEDAIAFDESGSDSGVADRYGHGTHVAGTIAAVANNQIGVVGVAPEAKILSIKALTDTGDGTYSGLASAVLLAAEYADVTNNSYGGTGVSSLLETAFYIAHSQGLISVSSVGNTNNDASSYIPAKYSSVVAVAASTESDERAYFSNYGNIVDIAAPGGGNLNGSGVNPSRNILSTITRGQLIANKYPELIVEDPNLAGTDYAFSRIAGTSMACPHVVGVAALIKSIYKEIRTEEFLTLIDETGEIISTDENINKRINALDAVKKIHDIYGVEHTKINDPESSVLSGIISLSGKAFREDSSRFSHYIISYTQDPESENWIVLNSSKEQVTNGLLLESFDTRNLENDFYTFELRSFLIKGGFSKDSIDVEILNTEAGPGDQERPSKPEIFTHSFPQPSDVQIQWIPGSDDVGIIEYSVLRDGVEIDRTNKNTYTDTRLSPSQNYEYQIIGIDGVGNESELSETYTIRTKDDESPPSKPNNAVAEALSATEIKLSWNAASDDFGRVKDYVIFQNYEEIATTPNLEYLSSNLKPDTYYSYYVKARDYAGNLSESSYSSARTLEDTEAPSIPNQLQAEILSGSAIKLSWTPSSDNSQIDFYQIVIYIENERTLTKYSDTNEFVFEDDLELKSYSFKVRARDIANNYSDFSEIFTLELTDQTAPTKPKNLEAFDVTDSSVSLRWDASEDNLRVQYYEIFQDGTKIGTSEELEYTVKSLKPSTNYEFYVVAVDLANLSSESSESLEVQSSPDVTAPSKPKLETVTSTSASEIEISWLASTDNDRVEDYIVFRDKVKIGTTKMTKFTDSGLHPRTSYSYQVQAKDPSGNLSELSNEESTKTLRDTTAPTTPSNLKLELLNNHEIKIAWNESIDNISIKFYVIYMVDSNERYYAIGNSYGQDILNEYIYKKNGGLESLSEYKFAIAAFDNSNNRSDYSETASIKTGDLEAPTKPENLKATLISDTSISFSWNDSTDDSGTVDHYEIYLNEKFHAHSIEANFHFSGLEPSSYYKISVVAVDNAGNKSSSSNSLYVQTLNETKPPSSPDNLKATLVSSSSIDLTWDASKDESGIDYYEIYLNSNFHGKSFGLSQKISNLQDLTEYTIHLVAVDIYGNKSELSDPLKVTTTHETNPPIRPWMKRASAISSSEIKIEWYQSYDNSGIKEYVLYRNEEEIKRTSELHFTDSNLAPSTSYSYKVAAVDIYNNTSDFSSELRATTQRDITRPSRPENLQVTEISESGFRLIWDESTDNIGVDHYDIYLDSQLISQSLDNSFSISDLNRATQYQVQVVAIDAAGNQSEFSDVLKLTTKTDSTPPTRPENLYLESVSDTEVEISWQASADTYSAIAAYLIYLNDEIYDGAINTNFKFSNLQQNVDYKVHILAIDEFGNQSKPSETLVFNTNIETNPPTSPEIINALAISESELRITWYPSYDESGIKEYIIYRDGKEISRTEKLEFIDSELSASTLYNYKLQSVDFYGNTSTFSLELEAETLADTEAPSIPQNLQATIILDKDVNLVWQASEDNVRTESYIIYRDNLVIGTSRETNFTDSNLNKDVNYEYRVSAKDQSNNESDQSNPITIKVRSENIEPFTPITLDDKDSSFHYLFNPNLVWRSLHLSKAFNGFIKLNLGLKREESSPEAYWETEENIPAGSYEISATWYPVTWAYNEVDYIIYSEGQEQGRKIINQAKSPNSFEDENGIAWHIISKINHPGGKIKIEMNKISGYLIQADAIRISKARGS